MGYIIASLWLEALRASWVFFLAQVLQKAPCCEISRIGARNTVIFNLGVEIQA
jgi:hypothetical protein